MRSLHELQRAFRDAMLHGACERVAPLVAGRDAEARLDVYRANFRSNLCAALRDVYPVVERLVGERFFEAAARRYIPDHPSASGDIHDYGADFADFLRAFAPAASLPYLADVARLEWGWHQVFHAADDAPLDPALLARVAGEAQATLRFALRPARRLLASPWPVHRIWQANQANQAGLAEVPAVDLDEGAARLLVRRETHGYAIEIVALEVGEFAFLDALARGMTLTGAYEQAVAVDRGFDLAAVLGRHLRAGTFAGVAARDETACTLAAAAGCPCAWGGPARCDENVIVR